MHYDTIVIGAGLAGLMAALGRAEAGAKTMLLAKGHGTTHWSTGCIDLYDTEGADLLPTLNELVARVPDHPYAIIGIAQISRAIERLRALCADAGYPLAGSGERNILLPTALGALRPTAYAPVTMINGDLRNYNGRMLVAGFHELRDFFPPTIAGNLRAQGYNAEGVYLELPPAGRSLDFSTVTFAHLFDQPAFRREVGQQLKKLVNSGRYDRVALPAVLGLEHPAAVVNDLQATAGALVVEIPTLPPSVPGMRLYRLLEQAAERAGVRVQIGSMVQRAEHEGQRVSAIYSEAAAREQRHRAAHYILATGGIIGGGLRADHQGNLRETALNLPVQVPPRNAWFNARFLAEAGHPIFRAGIAVDQQLRPRDEAGTIIYENVRVAGGVLAGADPIREGALEGIAVATGDVAGKL
jgi:glycerol-3-phosphate dehydrogenase subunit B